MIRDNFIQRDILCPSFFLPVTGQEPLRTFSGTTC